jgi:peptidoglycan/LPS O-acetylase OafA/YrhL
LTSTDIRQCGPCSRLIACIRVPKLPGHGFRYAPGLDGVRALALLAVVAYHIGTTSNHTLLAGGYLGVDVFFVLSGYLITSLLLVEARRTGRISIKNFYLRRARRLLPALYAMLIAVAAVGAYWLPQQATRLKGDLPASVFYYQNWWLIAQGSSYFGTAGDRPPMLTHLWSLAVEEQYYLVWPLVLIFFARIRARRALMLLLIGAGVLVSAGVGLTLYDPYSDPSRVYYGTDTRALAPLLGAFLAIANRPWLHRTRLPFAARAGLDLFGLVGLAGLAYIADTVWDSDQRLYQGGFLVIALFAAALVSVAGHRGTTLGWILGRQPLRYLGERSYAIYLWHWPVLLVTRPGIDIPVTGWANTALRVAIAVLLAEISFQVIEKPIRRNGFLAPLSGRARTATPAAGGNTHAVAPVGVTPPSGGYRVVGTAVVAQGPATRPPVRRSAGAILRTALLGFLLVASGTWAGLGLVDAGARPVAAGPVDPGADQSLGPLPTSQPTAGPAPTAAAPVRPALVPGATVAFFGDSQAMTLLLNRPPDLATYITAEDDTIEGCGIQLGKVDNRSGERRNLTADCANWRSVGTTGPTGTTRR